LNEIGEEQEEAVRQQDFIQAQGLLEKMKELQEELQRLNVQPNVVHEQVETLLLLIFVFLFNITSFSLVHPQKNWKLQALIMVQSCLSASSHSFAFGIAESTLCMLQI
jgi:seryl-tRNA synthetase